MMGDHKAASVTLSGAAASSELKRRLFVVNIYALLALLTLSIFGVLQLTVENNPTVGFLELAGAAAVALILIGLRLTDNVPLAKVCLLSTLLVFMVVMLTSGGTQGTGIFWLFL